MELEDGKLRAMHLAGTVALPFRYSATGEIWFEKRELKYRSVTRNVDLIYVYEKDLNDQESTRFVLNEHVEAMFFPGAKEGRGSSSTFRFAEEACDLKKGVWFLGPDVGARGIIFVPEIRAVYSMDEWAQTAGEVYYIGGCDPHYR
jgi:hypothetical protein